MKAATPDIEARLLEIDAQITDLAVEDDFRKIIQEDLELAKSYFKSKNVLGVINCLLVIIGKLHTHIIAARCPCAPIEPLLICIHHLLQKLIKLPVTIVGPTGATGATGPIGPAGSTGPKGATGATGPAGCDGVVGATGATGPIGPAGSTGPKGVTGATGPAGCDGAVGATGATGPVGPAGNIGPKGATGATGPAGSIGAVGATGATGPIGPAGSPGPEGPIGATGPTGPAGTTNIISSCTIPVCDFPVECKKPIKSQCIDYSIHTEFICKPKNPFHN